MASETDLLTITEAAAACSMSYGTLRKRIASDNGPEILIVGLRSFIRRGELNAWVKKQAELRAQNRVVESLQEHFER